jgi:hypothetical protein
MSDLYQVTSPINNNLTPTDPYSGPTPQFQAANSSVVRNGGLYQDSKLVHLSRSMHTR